MADDFEDVQSDLEKLVEGDKQAKRRALENLASFLKSIRDELPENKRKALVSLVVGPLLSVLSDASERCREAAAQVLLELCSTLPDDATAYVFATLKAKLESEPCEEVRLLEARALTHTVKGGKCAKHLDEIVDAVRSCLADPFPQVNKEGCRCVLELERAAPHHFHLQCESLLAPLLRVARHQHSAVRVLAVQALGPVVQQSGIGAPARVLPVANALLHDDSPSVRTALATAASRWLARDPSPEALSVLLTMLSVPGTEDRAAALWAEAGLAHARETLAGDSAEGCDALVRRNLSFLVGSALDALEDWRPEDRERGARLLLGVLPHAGRDAEPLVAEALPVLVAALEEDEPRVAPLVERVLATVGRVATPDAWVEPLAGSCSAGNLRALRALVKACPPQQLRPYAHRLFDALFRHATTASEARSRSEVVESLDAVLSSVSDPMELSVEELLCACLGLRAAAGRDPSAEKARNLLEHVSRLLGLPGVEDLCVVYGKDLVQDLSENRASSSSRWDVLQELVLHAGDRRVDLVPSLVALLNASQQRPEWQPEAAALLELALLSGETRTEADSPTLPSRCAGPLLGALLPLLGGKAEARTRVAALRCLHGLPTRTSASTPQESAEVSAAVAHLLEDRHPQVRAAACRAVPRWVPRTAAAPGLAGRLDDVSAEVRVAAVRALGHVVTEETLPDVLRKLSLHARDPDAAVRSACSALATKLTEDFPSACGAEDG